MILTNYAECSIIETLDTNQTLGNESLLDGWHKCFIYFTICSIPTTLGTNETLGRKEKVQSVFIPTLGSDIRLGTYSSLPECYFLDTRTEGALGTNFSVPNVLFPTYSVQWDTRYKWIGFLWASASKFFCDAWFQEYTSGSKFCKF
jgi:hypothetical protein